MLAADLLFAPATRLLALLRSRSIGAPELVDAHLERIARLNPKLNAIVTLTAEQARTEADDADRRLARGDGRPLEGLPVTIKDTLETGGIRSTAGTKLFEHHVPASDAVAVARFRDAGAIMLGKTNVPELALDYDCDNPVFGRSNNPWDPARTPGGSSGGEAAAIAAGMSPLGLGSDLGGSIRTPAHFCGITGLKPTLEAIPRTGHMPAGVAPISVATTGTVGPMARTVDDLTFAFNLLRGPHPSDPYILPTPPADPAAIELRGLRCAYYTDGGSTPVAAPIRAAVTRAAEALRAEGLTVDERRPPGLDRGFDLFSQWVLGDGGAGFRMLAGDRYGDFRPALRRTLESQRELSLLEFVMAGIGRDVLRSEVAAHLTEFPVILGPTLPIPAFRHDHDGHDVEGVHVDHLAPIWGTCWVNLTGLPAVVVPAGATPDGLPIGVQLVGAPFTEGRLLAVAAVIERRLGGYRRPPLE